MPEHFVMIPDSIVRGGILTPIEAVVYSNLLSHQGQNESAWPSLQTIAKEVKTSKKSVQRAIQKLISYGLVTKKPRFTAEQKQTSNDYFVRNASGWSHRHRAMVTRTTKGDSVQEDSDKTSTESMRRDWGQLSDSKPPTRKQLALIDDYVEKLGEDLDFDEINGSISVAPTTQLEAHQQIHYLHVKFAQREMFG